jgi:predicted polyphosphate/ATP-dependent NAD kinase
MSTGANKTTRPAASAMISSDLWAGEARLLPDAQVSDWNCRQERRGEIHAKRFDTVLHGRTSREIRLWRARSTK